MATIHTSLSDSNIKDIEDIIAYKGKIVTARDIKNALKGKYTDKTIKKKVYVLKTKGWLIAFKKGVYFISDIASRGFVGLSPNVIAGAFIEGSYVTSLSAFSYYGFIEQMQRTITSAVTGKSREFEFQDRFYRFRGLKQNLFFGSQVVMTDGYRSHIAELEKAVLDSIYFEHDSHSLETVLEVFGKVQKRIDIKKLIEYSKNFPETTRRILGFLLERAGFNTAELNKIVSKKGVSRMSSGSKMFSAKWRLYYEDRIIKLPRPEEAVPKVRNYFETHNML